MEVYSRGFGVMVPFIRSTMLLAEIYTSWSHDTAATGQKTQAIYPGFSVDLEKNHIDKNLDVLSERDSRSILIGWIYAGFMVDAGDI